ncbi:ankyrin repeat protein [Cordyceps militaris CM01]|uniref:Ankyrin repeat protein n=1 Tax=Cordyceps militaris (strain CM01) TaxID=983644 RepID=G3JQH7_CORMM|nr:ankyrin repeat protein [Cordyceps militaris CM01]EGX89481.1 ankyrin repeat protein [Cordyceps militaris CM01]
MICTSIMKIPGSPLSRRASLSNSNPQPRCCSFMRSRERSRAPRGILEDCYSVRDGSSAWRSHQSNPYNRGEFVRCRGWICLFVTISPTKTITSNVLPPGSSDMEPDERTQMGKAFKSPETRLHAHVRDRDTRQLRLAVAAAELEIDHFDCEFGTALNVAVRCDNHAAVDIFLDAGADLWKGGTEAPTSPIVTAISSGNINIFSRFCEKLAQGGSSVPTRRCNYILTQAARYGDIPILKEVLTWQAEWLTVTQMSALGAAVANWQVEAAKLLQNRFQPTRRDLTSFLRSAVGFKSDVVDLCPEYGSVDYLHQKELVSFLISVSADPDDTTDGPSPILAAVEFVDLVGALQALLEQGAQPNTRGREGETALHRLGVPIRYKKYTGQCQLHEAGVRLLLAHGALYLDHLPPHSQDPLLWVDMKNDKGETLLHWAAAGKSLDVIRFLIERGANSPLMCALAPTLKYGRSGAHNQKAVQAAKILLQHGADPGVQTSEFWTPLHCLAQHADDDDRGEIAAMANHLIQNGGRSVATRATLPRGSSSGAIGLWGSLVPETIQADGDDIVVRLGMPLHWAVAHGAVSVAAALIASNADLEITDGDGNRPADLIDSSPRLRRRLAWRDKMTQLLAGSQAAMIRRLRDTALHEDFSMWLAVPHTVCGRRSKLIISGLDDDGPAAAGPASSWTVKCSSATGRTRGAAAAGLAMATLPRAPAAVCGQTGGSSRLSACAVPSKKMTAPPRAAASTMTSLRSRSAS